jgi:hypothetical protein
MRLLNHLVLPLFCTACAEGYQLEDTAESPESTFPDVDWVDDSGPESEDGPVSLHRSCATDSDCDDENPCTAEACSSAGFCVVTAAESEHENPCMVAACDPEFGWSWEVVADDDGDACTEDICVPEFGATLHLPVRLDDLDVCTIDACDSDVGVFRTALDCDDASACTEDGCHSDVGCFHLPVVYFHETFERGDAWQLDALWTIGSVRDESGFAEVAAPSVDHTASDDNRSLWLAQREGLPFSEFTGPIVASSPGVDLSSAKGEVFLEYTFAVGGAIAAGDFQVQVWNGESWVTVDSPWAESFSPELEEAGWSSEVVDVTAHANADFRIRFAVSPGVDVRGVSVDDVRLLPARNCP